MARESQLVACTLGNDELRDRRVWIAELARDALCGHRIDDLVLHLRYRPEAVARVREMVCLERACCAFLTFEMDERPDQVLLTITAPDAARGAVGTIFDQFTKPAGALVDCGCPSDTRP